MNTLADLEQLEVRRMNLSFSLFESDE